MDRGFCFFAEMRISMSNEQPERSGDRKAVRGAYVEYSKAGTRLARLFHQEIKRGPLVDISNNGVSFRTTETIDHGESLFMALRFPQLGEPVKLKAEVCWVREEKKTGIENYTHLIGARFVEYAPDAAGLIGKAMNE